MENETIYLLSISIIITTFFAIVSLKIIKVFTSLGNRAFDSNNTRGKPKSLGLLFQRSNFFRLMIIVIIIFSIVILSILGKMDAHIISIFASISGFALGDMRSNTYDDNPKSSKTISTDKFKLGNNPSDDDIIKKSEE